MDDEKKCDAPDYERIAKEIIEVLRNAGVSYRETDIVIEYVYGYLMAQPVQDCD